MRKPRPRNRLLRIVAGTFLVVAILLTLVQTGKINVFEPIIRGPENAYGKFVADLAPIHVAYKRPLRAGILDTEDIESLAKGNWHMVTWKQLSTQTSPSDQIEVLPITPEISDYHELMSQIKHDDIEVMVECSAVDAWHTSSEGWTDLKEVHKQVLRVVIFDGGHHIPTLALQPDLIIVPLTSGYAAHGYMDDAVALESLQKLATREKLTCSIVAVPRWALVKTPASMSRIAVRALAMLQVDERSTAFNGQVLRPHLTYRGASGYFYFNDITMVNDTLIHDLHNAGIQKIYTAFNYSVIND
ncbi:MAG: hypothetical protein ACM3QW_08095, partial [Ignavibacteriales bacterium]